MACIEQLFRKAGYEIIFGPTERKQIEEEMNTILDSQRRLHRTDEGASEAREGIQNLYIPDIIRGFWKFIRN